MTDAKREPWMSAQLEKEPTAAAENGTVSCTRIQEFAAKHNLDIIKIISEKKTSLAARNSTSTKLVSSEPRGLEPCDIELTAEVLVAKRLNVEDSRCLTAM